jgi:hypothetical protein
MILPVNRRSIDQMQRHYRQRLRVTPEIAGPCGAIEKKLGIQTKPEDVHRTAAGEYASYRRTSSIFVHFEQSDLDIYVQAGSGIFLDGPASFACESPTTGLIARTLIDRVSIHVPDLAKYEVEFISDNYAAKQAVSGLRGAMPYGFKRTNGSALITPLGIERSSDLGFGFIFEYDEQAPFSLESIIEARTYSSLFTLKIAEKYLEQLKH